MRLIILFIAAALSAFAAFFVWQFTSEKPQPPEDPVVVDSGPVETPIPIADPKPLASDVPEVDVVIARADIPVGSEIDTTMIDYQRWPKHLLVPGFVVRPEQGAPPIVGKMTRTVVKARQPILDTMLANPNDPSFLPGVLSEDMRAITIPVDAITGVGGFVFPGDRVDVMITQEFIYRPKKGNADDVFGRGGVVENRENITEILLPNVRVLAINQRTVANNADPKAKDAGNPLPSNVTLEVTPKDAEKLRLAEKEGRLSLVLRSIKDKDKIDIATRPVGPGDLSRTTPPSFYPVLYDFNSDYQPAVVSLFGEGTQAAQAGANGVSIPTMPQLPTAPRMNLPGDQSKNNTEATPAVTRATDTVKPEAPKVTGYGTAADDEDEITINVVRGGRGVEKITTDRP